MLSGIMPILKSQTVKTPVKVAVIGLTHTHVHWILGRENHNDIQIVAIVEPNRELAERYSKQHGFSMDIVFNTIEEMFTKTKPEVVTAFGTIYDHLKVVEFCAPPTFCKPIRRSRPPKMPRVTSLLPMYLGPVTNRLLSP